MLPHGAHLGLSYADYDADPGVRASELKRVEDGVEAFVAERLSPSPPTEALVLGNAVHALVLEGWDAWADRYVEKDWDERTKKGKERAKEEIAHGYTILTKAQMESVRLMSYAIPRHPGARAALEACQQREVSFFAEIEDARAKARADAFDPDSGFIIDLKTTSAISPGDWSRQMFNLRYFVQAAWYVDTIAAATERDPRDLVYSYVIVHSKPPYEVAVRPIKSELIKWGRGLYRRLLPRVLEYRRIADEREDALSYPDIEECDIPAWGYRQLEDMLQ